jgi:hypothetical protein
LKRIYLIIILSWLLINKASAQKEGISSRFYFPGLIGIGIPSGDEQTSVRSGFALNTAIEYRPTYINDFFIRFNYDNITNKYNSFFNPIPTNINHGKVSADFFLLGVGYREKINKLGVYALLQPGYSRSVYNVVSTGPSGISLTDASSNHLAFKAVIGLEYYIVPHFALIVEPGYYRILKTSPGYVLNPNYLSYTIGFTTTLF